MAEFSLISSQDGPDFLDLPWDVPLAEWDNPRIVHLVKGRSRHVVRMVRYDDRVYALKETTEFSAMHEYQVLRELKETRLPTVDPVGYVTGRHDPDGNELGAIIITRFLDYALPYGYLFTVEKPGYLREHLLDAAVILLVRLHKDHVFWGDASFGNVLFRRDAGRLMAYLVDAETSEVHSSISDQMREYDLDIARENVAGGLYDLLASGAIDEEIDPIEVVDELRDRYRRLWAELSDGWRLPADERWKIRERIRRLNELGFDVDEMRIESTDGGNALWIQPMVVEEGHSHRELIRLTGLQAQENQARRLLSALYSYGAWLEQHEGITLSDELKASRWLNERYRAVLGAIPPELEGKLDGPEVYHHFLNHLYFLSEAQQRDVPLETAVASFIDNWLSSQNDEKFVAATPLIDELTAHDGPLDRAGNG